ncbi:hypothetical protein SY27_11180 [Flavobacterium sp. 316]|uniref:hypothetical protein n=1 Tax=Flavobacterium sp. 316 TaxID=1603293 RepID=UPI0005E3CFB9|nr:hypothetical protein [Flavobacterium sp. 316]KIX20472.1 hypothetical protein SY27_11180 [Flavobacterium sp. 316]
MKRIMILSLCLLLTSCFEITERIKHNSDQSGDYSLVIDFSKSWFRTRSAIWLEEVDGVSIPSEEDIKKKLSDFRIQASKIDGISDILTKHDFKNYIFTLKFKYTNLNALNAVLNSMNKENPIIHFNESKTTAFERFASYPIPKNLIKNDDKKEDLEAANITSIYTFDKEVTNIKNPKSKISKNKRTVFLKQNVYNVLKNNTLMNNTIYFNP